MSDFASIDTDGMTVETTSMSQPDLEAQFAAPAADPTLEATEEAGTEAAAAPAKTDPKPEPKKRSDPVSRMLDATAKEAAAKRERDEAKAEAARYRAELDAARARPEPAREAPKQEQAAKQPTQADWARYKAHPDAPKIAEFEDYTDYNAALSVFVADQRFAEHQAQRQRYESDHAQSTAFAARLGATAEERQAFIQTIDPRLANMDRLSALPPGQPAHFGNFLVEQIYRSEHPKELLTHFTAHEADVQRLSTLHPMAVIRELGKLEASLAAPAASRQTGTAAPIPVSKARPPITPVGGSASATSADEASDDEPVEAYIRRENARDAKARRAS